MKAYVLGFAWADGAINTPLNCLAFVSKDDLIPLRDIFYGPDRPVYRRKSGTYQLNVASRRIVQELVELGFTPQKSRQGSPTIPPGLEQYFLLGLLDGDGCVYSTTDVLRVFYCGNAEPMELVYGIGKRLVGVHFLARESTGRNPSIEGRSLRNNHICHTLQLPDIRQSQIFLNMSTERAIALRLVICSPMKRKRGLTSMPYQDWDSARLHGLRSHKNLIRAAALGKDVKDDQSA